MKVASLTQAERWRYDLQAWSSAMDDLRTRFGRLVAAHRRKRGFTQEVLAEKAGITANMISKIELGSSGARFPVIERLAKALEVDPAELFTTNVRGGVFDNTSLSALTARLAALSDDQMSRVSEIVELWLRPSR